MTRDRPLIDIGYKYNYKKVIYFISTEDSGSTKDGNNYLPEYPDQFANVAICPVDFPLLIYNLFGSVNEVEPHNKSRQYDLVLEKY